MVKMTVSVIGFVAVMLMGIVPGYCGNSAVCQHNNNCRTDAATPAQTGQVDKVNLAAENMLRQLVNDATARATPAR